MRKSTEPVLQTSMFLSVFSHRGSLRAQGIGKVGRRGGGGEGVRTHPAHAHFFFPLSRPLQTLACPRLSVSADEGKKWASSKNAGHTCYPAPPPPPPEG